METADGAAEILHRHVLRGEDEVDSVLMVNRKRRGFNRAGDHLLDREAREVGPMGVTSVSKLLGYDDAA